MAFVVTCLPEVAGASLACRLLGSIPRKKVGSSRQVSLPALTTDGNLNVPPGLRGCVPASASGSRTRGELRTDWCLRLASASPARRLELHFTVVLSNERENTWGQMDPRDRFIQIHVRNLAKEVFQAALASLSPSCSTVSALPARSVVMLQGMMFKY